MSFSGREKRIIEGLEKLHDVVDAVCDMDIGFLSQFCGPANIIKTLMGRGGGGGGGDEDDWKDGNGGIWRGGDWRLKIWVNFSAHAG